MKQKILLKNLLLTGMVLSGAAKAAVDCSAQPWDVADEADLNAAIVCYGQKASGDHTINLTGDIALSASTTAIENTSGAKLIINGANYKIDGQGKNGVRPIMVKASTNVFLKNIEITGGRSDNGGGIANYGNLVMENSTVSNNRASNGGGILNYASLALANSTVEQNRSSRSAGGILNQGRNSSMELDSVTVGYNSSPQGGGILNNGGSTLRLTNSTVHHNYVSAFDGGGISNYGDLVLINSTVYRNTSSYSSSGAGIMTSGDVTLVNTIIANNKGNDCDREASVIVNAEYSLISDSDHACGIVATAENGNIIGSDPKLRDLADHGGNTLTYALLSDSPALNTGTANTSIPDITIPSNDQRGVSRTANGAPDIGAYEAQIVTLSLSKAGDGGGTLTPSAGEISLVQGSEVTITANADANSIFAGWSGACTGTSVDCTLTMDTDKTVTATFEQNNSPVDGIFFQDSFETKNGVD